MSSFDLNSDKESPQDSESCRIHLELADSSPRPTDIEQIEKVFWETSKNQANTAQSFIDRWLHIFLESPSRLLVTAKSQGQVVGYLVCEMKTKTAPRIWEEHKSLRLFESTLPPNDFAHFHMNVSPEFQGLGVGRKLLETLFKNLEERGETELYVVTGAHAPNVSFYLAVGFERLETKRLGESELLLLVRNL